MYYSVSCVFAYVPNYSCFISVVFDGINVEFNFFIQLTSEVSRQWKTSLMVLLCLVPFYLQ